MATFPEIYVLVPYKLFLATVFQFLGKSWSEPKKTVLLNNNAAIQAHMLASGRMAIVFNPTHSARVPIRIAVSEDGGKTWPHYRVCVCVCICFVYEE